MKTSVAAGIIALFTCSIVYGDGGLVNCGVSATFDATYNANEPQTVYDSALGMFIVDLPTNQAQFPYPIDSNNWIVASGQWSGHASTATGGRLTAGISNAGTTTVSAAWSDVYHIGGTGAYLGAPVTQVWLGVALTGDLNAEPGTEILGCSSARILARLSWQTEHIPLYSQTAAMELTAGRYTPKLGGGPWFSLWEALPQESANWGYGSVQTWPASTAFVDRTFLFGPIPVENGSFSLAAGIEGMAQGFSAQVDFGHSFAISFYPGDDVQEFSVQSDGGFSQIVPEPTGALLLTPFMLAVGLRRRRGSAGPHR